jgi:protein SCO1/2
MSRFTAGFLAIILLAVLPAGGGPSAAEKPKRTVENYTVPDVVLVNQNGVKVPLKKFLETGKPVMLDFIYGTCTTRIRTRCGSYRSPSIPRTTPPRS